jgi:hypothetical protein
VQESKHTCMGPALMTRQKRLRAVGGRRWTAIGKGFKAGSEKLGLVTGASHAAEPQTRKEPPRRLRVSWNRVRVHCALSFLRIILPLTAHLMQHAAQFLNAGFLFCFTVHCSILDIVLLYIHCYTHTPLPKVLHAWSRPQQFLPWGRCTTLAYTSGSQLHRLSHGP